MSLPRPGICASTSLSFTSTPSGVRDALPTATAPHPDSTHSRPTVRIWSAPFERRPQRGGL